MSKVTVEEIVVDGNTYVRKGTEVVPAARVDGLEYVIIRTQNAGVFAGYLEEFDGEQATLVNGRRLWYWSGAASLSQLAVDGTSKPGECKFPVAVPNVTLTQVIEVLSVSEKAQKSIQDVKVWAV